MMSRTCATALLEDRVNLWRFLHIFSVVIVLAPVVFALIRFAEIIRITGG